MARIIEILRLAIRDMDIDGLLLLDIKLTYYLSIDRRPLDLDAV